MLSVTYFYREPRKTGVSIEGIFRLVKECLKGQADIREFYCDINSSRLQNTISAKKSAGKINHITGDVQYLAIGLKGRNVVLTIHDIGHYETLKKRSRLRAFVFKLFWLRLPLKYADVVTVVSEFTKSKLIEYFGVPPSKIRLIPDPVKPIFKFVAKEKINEKPVILMMGTGQHKNLGNLIEASKGSNFHLDIVGWPSSVEIENLKDYGISHNISNGLSDEEVYARYIACDVMYNASFYEGFGMPIIEAQCVGRPVVTSNLGAMKEVARDTAILVDPNNPAEIKAAIVQLIDNPVLYQKMVVMGRQNIIRFQYEEIAQQYLNVYKEFAN